jgi:hypothetical protein
MARTYRYRGGHGLPSSSRPIAVVKDVWAGRSLEGGVMWTSRIARVLTAPVLAAAVLLMGAGPGTATQGDDQGDDRGDDRGDDQGDDRGDDPVAETTFGNVSVEVTELERTSGRTVTLRFVIANDGSEEFELWDHFGEDANDWTMGGVYLFDEANSTKYLSLREGGEENLCVCTELESSIEVIEARDERDFFVKFPAPPRSTETVAVVLPTVGTVDAVEIAE